MLCAHALVVLRILQRVEEARLVSRSRTSTTNNSRCHTSAHTLRTSASAHWPQRRACVEGKCWECQHTLRLARLEVVVESRRVEMPFCL